jgi:hypothetical protein
MKMPILLIFSFSLPFLVKLFTDKEMTTMSETDGIASEPAVAALLDALSGTSGYEILRTILLRRDQQAARIAELEAIVARLPSDKNGETVVPGRDRVEKSCYLDGAASTVSTDDIEYDIESETWMAYIYTFNRSVPISECTLVKEG